MGFFFLFYFVFCFSMLVDLKPQEDINPRAIIYQLWEPSGTQTFTKNADCTQAPLSPCTTFMS